MTAEKPKSGGKPNIDEAVQFYKKKWNVSEEEAIEKISKLVEERKAPTMENLFPEPLGPLSAKIQDVNQALLSTAITKRKMEDLQHPPRQASGIERSIDEAVAETGKNIITERLSGDPIRKKIDDVLGDFLAEGLTEKLSGASTEKILDAKFDEFSEKVVVPLFERLKALEGENGGKKGPLTTDAAIDMVLSASEKAKKLLTDQGYSVQSVNITKAEVEKMLKEEKAKMDEHMKAEKDKWEKESGAEVAIEQERIRVTETILTNVSDRVMDMFLVPIKAKIEEAIEKGAFKGPPAQ